MATYEFQPSIKITNITTSKGITTSGDPGTDLNITTGTGDNAANGGDIYITPGLSTGAGSQGSIIFTALDAANPIPLNEAGDTDLNIDFAATSIVGALNELKTGGGGSIAITDPAVGINPVAVDNVAGAITVVSSRIIEYNSTFNELQAVFEMSVGAGATTTHFTFTLPDAAVLTNRYDVTITNSSWADTVPEEPLSNVLIIGAAGGTTCNCYFTSYNNTVSHYIQIIAKYYIV